MTCGAFLHKPERARKKPKGLRRQSAKRAAFAPVRAAFVTEMLARYPVCMVCPLLAMALGFGEAPTVKEQKALCDSVDTWGLTDLARYPRWARCTLDATLLHEPLTRNRAGRTNDNLLDPDNAVPSCFNGHRFLHDHDELSTSVGLLRSAEVARG